MHGNPTTVKPRSPYARCSCSSCSYCGVSPHFEATLTTRTTLSPRSDERRGAAVGGLEGDVTHIGGRGLSHIPSVDLAFGDGPAPSLGEWTDVTIAIAPARTLRIGPIELDAPVVLAPMAGITNTAFRRLCREYGAGLYVSEMITSRALVERNETTMRLITHHESETPRSIQLYGVDPATVERGRAHPRRRGPRRPHRPELRLPRAQGHAQGRRSGAPVEARAVPRHRHAGRTAAGDVPLTVKMRKGIDSDHLTYLDAGRIAEDAGVAAVALHARTAAEFYSGHADWTAIAELKQAVTSVPVLGNGDIWSADDAVRMMDETDCDGVVVGRGCLGRPWLFGDLAARLRRARIGARAAGRRDARLRRRRLPSPRGAARRVLRRRGPRMPRHPQARRLVLQGLPGRRRHACRASRRRRASPRSTTCSRPSTSTRPTPVRPPRVSAGAQARPSGRRCRTAGSSRASSGRQASRTLAEAELDHSGG